MVGLGGGAAAKFKPFQNMVILHIKLKLTKLVASILPTDTPLTRGGGAGVKMSNHIFFVKEVMLPYQIKGNLAKSTIKANMLILHTPTVPVDGSNGHIFFLKVVMLHIKLNWKCRPTCKVTL